MQRLALAVFLCLSFTFTFPILFTSPHSLTTPIRNCDEKEFDKLELKENQRTGG